MKNILQQLLRFIVFLSAGFVVLYLVFNSLNKSYHEDCALKGIPSEECSLMDKLWSDFTLVDPFWIFMLLFAFMISNVLRSYKWQMLISPLGHKMRFWVGFHAIMLGYFANLGLPRMGEIIRAVAISKNEKIPLEKVIGTIVSGRIIDFILLGIFMMLGFIFSFDAIWGFLQENMSNKLQLGTSIIMAISLLVILGGIAYFARSWWMKISFIQKITEKIISLWHAMLSIKNLERPLAFIIYSTGIWIMYYLMVLFCFYAFEPTSMLTAEAGLVVFDFGALGMVAPFPGGMGSYHFMIIKGLSLYGVDEIEAFSFANINFFSVQIFGNILFGLIALVALPMIKSKSNDKKYS